LGFIYKNRIIILYLT